VVDVSDSGELNCPDAEALGGKICAAARWRGERYDRHEAVQALFRMPLLSEDQKAA
jgi:hypothetical protein